MMSGNIIVRIIIILFFFIQSCTLDDETLTELTATFTADFLCPDCEPGILFYSDMDGEELWSGTWNGNTELLAEVETDGPLDRMSMTTVVLDPRYDRVKITTNLNVKSDDYIWYGGGVDYRWSEYQGSVDLTFTNIPNHNGYWVSSKAAYTGSTSGIIPSQINKSLYSTTDNIFVNINTDDYGPSYIWHENVLPGGSADIDLQNLMPMNSQAITIPDLNYSTYLSVRGFSDSYYNGYYQVHRDQSYYYSTNIMEIYYPASLFTDYRTYAYVSEPGADYSDYWYMSCMGEIPSEVEMLDVDFIFDDTSPTHPELFIAGDFTQISYHLGYFDENDREFIWTIYTDLKSIELPELPQLVYDTYPTLRVGDFQLNSAAVHRNDDLTYDEHIELFFKSGAGFYDIVTTAMTRSKVPE